MAKRQQKKDKDVDRVTAQLRKILEENPPLKPSVYSKKSLPFYELSQKQQVEALKQVKAKHEAKRKAQERRAKAAWKRKARAPE